MSYEKRLDTVIENQIEELEQIKVGSNEYDSAVNNICRMIDKSVELKKVRVSEESKEIECKLKESQIEREQKEKKTQFCLDVGKIVIPVIVTVWGTLKSFKFEETGTVTTILGRRHVSNLIKK